MYITPKQTHLKVSNLPGQRRRKTFPECRCRHLVEVAITVLVVGHSIANDAADQS